MSETAVEQDKVLLEMTWPSGKVTLSKPMSLSMVESIRGRYTPILNRRSLCVPGQERSKPKVGSIWVDNDRVSYKVLSIPLNYDPSDWKPCCVCFKTSAQDNV